MISKTESDAKGYSCSDTIVVNACWGRCDSKEISDWKFPFKKSHHPVCVHSGTSVLINFNEWISFHCFAGRTKVTTILRNCDPEASMEAKKYEYMEANSCSCQICSTIDTSCESPQALTRTGGSVVKLIGTDLEEDYPLLPDKN